jgi:hypothetical protein
MGGPDPSEVCLGVKRSDQMLWGDFIRVPEGEQVTISAIGLVDADGIEVKDAWIAPPLEGALGASEYPPVASPSWDARVPAQGAEAQGGHNNVVLLLERTGEEQGTATAMRVEYSAGGWDYAVHGSMSVIMRDDCIDETDDS